MIRNLVNIVMCFVVVTTTTGLVVNKHYSNGKLYSASLYSNPESCCVEKDHNDSCHEETEILKITSPLHSSSQKTLVKFSSNLVKIDFEIRSVVELTVFHNTTYKPKISPYKIPLRAFIQVFLI